MRNTPELVQFYLIYYALPTVGVRFGAFQAAIAVLGLHYAVYLSEVFRSGIESINRNQWDAALVLGLPRVTTWRRVVLPQVFQRVIPPLGNYLIAMFKVTSLAAAITVHELFWTAKDIATRDYRFFEVFTVAGLIYFAVSYPSAIGVRRLEVWLRRSEIRMPSAQSRTPRWRGAGA